MHDVFISYSFKNAKIADAICHHLESRAIRCWYAPRDVDPGSDWPTSIVNAITRAKVFILVFSEDSNASDDVEKELSLAIKNGCIVIPFRIDKAALSAKLSYFLNNIHWLDALSDSMEESIHRLGNVVSKNIAKTDEKEIIDTDDDQKDDTISDDDGKKDIEEIIISDDDSKYDIEEIIVSDDIVNGKKDEKKDDINPTPPPPPKPKKFKKALIISLIVVFAILTALYFIGISVEEEPKKEAVAIIPFQQLNLDAEHIYPFKAACGFSEGKDLFFLQSRETNKLTAAQTNTGKFIPGNSGIDFESEDIASVVIRKSDSSDIVYFLDNQKIAVYDLKKCSWINKEGLTLPLASTEYIDYSVTYRPDLQKGNAVIDDMILIVYDTAKNNGIYSKLIYVTPDKVVSTTDISSLNIKEIINSFDTDLFESNGTEPILGWNHKENLIAFDLISGKVLCSDFKEIYKKYMPYINETHTISPNKKYIIKTNVQQNDEEYYTHLNVWDIENGKTVFSDNIIGNTSYYFNKDSKLLLYKQGELFEIDAEKNQRKKLLDKSYFSDNDIFQNIPFAFEYLKKLDLCVWDTFYHDKNDKCFSKIVITNLSGNILYQSYGFDVPFDGYYPANVVGDDYILHFFYSNEGVEMKSENGYKPYNLYSMPLRATYSYDSEGNIIFE